MKRASSSLFVFVLTLGLAAEAIAQSRPQRPSQGGSQQGPQRPQTRPQQPSPSPAPAPRPQQPIPQPAPIPSQGQHGQQHGPHHGPQIPMPRERQVVDNALISLRVNQYVRGQQIIDLEQLIRMQNGLTLQGAEIQRVVVDGQSMERYGRAASVSVLLNGHYEGRESDIDQRRGRAPIPLNSYEEVRQGLQVLVRGEARIDTIHIRVGRVRPLRMR